MPVHTHDVHAVLSVHALVTLAAIAHACQRNQLVTILEEGGRISVGTARALCKDDRGMFLGAGDDVRDGFVWLTMRSGLERFVPVDKMASGVEAGTIALDFDGSC